MCLCPPHPLQVSKKDLTVSSVLWLGSPWKVLHFGGGKMVHLTMGEPWSSSLEYLLDKEAPTQTSGRVGEESMTTKPPNLLGSFSARTKWFISSHLWTLFTLLKSMMHRQVYMNCATEEEKFNQLCNVPPPICLTSRDRFELSWRYSAVSCLLDSKIWFGFEVHLRDVAE